MEIFRSTFQGAPKSQNTACSSTVKPLGRDAKDFPSCRYALSYSSPGQYSLSVRVYKRGSHHVEEVALPILVVEPSKITQINDLQIIPPPDLKYSIRIGSIDEKIAASNNIFSPPRSASLVVEPIKILPGESLVPDTVSVSVKSSNSASYTISPLKESLKIIVNLQSGPGFDRRRAWFSADVRATIRTEVSAKPIILDSYVMRSPEVRQVYSQPVPDKSKIRFSLQDGRQEELSFGEWSAHTQHNIRIRFLQKDNGLVAETQIKNN